MYFSYFDIAPAIVVFMRAQDLLLLWMFYSESDATFK